jgi:hypothetical protein
VNVLTPEAVVVTTGLMPTNMYTFGVAVGRHISSCRLPATVPEAPASVLHEVTFQVPGGTAKVEVGATWTISSSG